MQRQYSAEAFRSSCQGRDGARNKDGFSGVEQKSEEISESVLCLLRLTAGRVVITSMYNDFVHCSRQVTQDFREPI